MRIASNAMLTLFACLHSHAYTGDVFGVWRVNPRRSANPYKHAVVIRFEPRRQGEVFTLDVMERDGRSTTSSSILYLDGQARAFDGFGCSGTQSSRKLDFNTVEILRTCHSGEWTRFVRYFSADAKALVIEITEQHAEGRAQRRLVLERE